MKKIYLTISLLLSLAGTSSAFQFFDKFYIGGGVGLSLSGSASNFEVQPLIGYHITQPWSVGVQFYYSYYNDDNMRQNGYGGGVFTRYDVPMPRVINKVFPAMLLHAEYDYISYNTHNKFYDTDYTQGYNMLPMGVGVYLGSGRGRVSITALWDVLHISDNGGAPILRLGVIF